MARDSEQFGGTSTGSLGAIGSAIRLTVKQNGLDPHLRPHQALALWADVAGEQIAAAASAEAVRGGVLFVRAKSSVWANELTFYKPDLLRRLNQRLGDNTITDIHFQSGSAAKRKESAKPAATDVKKSNPLNGIALPPTQSSLADPQERLNSLVERTRTVLAWKREHGWQTCSRCAALYEPAAKTSRRSRFSAKKPVEPVTQLCPVCRALTRQ